MGKPRVTSSQLLISKTWYRRKSKSTKRLMDIESKYFTNRPKLVDTKSMAVQFILLTTSYIDHKKHKSIPYEKCTNQYQRL